MKNNIIDGFDDVKNDNLKITLSSKNDILIAILNGMIDTYNSDFFVKKIEMIKKTDYIKMVIDLSGISYISSTGMGALIQILKMFSSFTPVGKLFLSGITPKVMEVFNLLGFSSFFKTFDTIDEAVFFMDNDKLKTTEEKKIFPTVIKCSFCGRKLKVVKQGKFRCPSCKYIIIINNDGSQS